MEGGNDNELPEQKKGEVRAAHTSSVFTDAGYPL